jgi:hypothetical protein
MTDEIKNTDEDDNDHDDDNDDDDDDVFCMVLCHALLM